MKRIRRDARRSIGLDLRLEALEDRVVLSGTKIIAGLPFDYNTIVRAVKHDTAIISQDSKFLYKHPDLFKQIDPAGKLSALEFRAVQSVDSLQAATNDLAAQMNNLKADQSAVNEIVAAKTQALQDVLGQQTLSSIQETNAKVDALNAQILAIQDNPGNLTPAQQQSAINKLEKQEVALADVGGATVSKFRDRIGGEERAVIFLGTTSGQKIGITLGKATYEEAQGQDLLNQIAAEEGIQRGPAQSIGALSGTFTEIDPNGGPTYNSRATGDFTTTGGIFQGRSTIDNFPTFKGNAIVGTGFAGTATFDGTVDAQGKARGTYTLKANTAGSQGTKGTFTAIVSPATGKVASVVIQLTDSNGNPVGVTISLK